MIIDNYPHGQIKINETIEVFKDKSNKLTIEDIFQYSDSLPFQKISSNYFSDGFTDAAYWVRFTLKNAQDEEKELLLELEYPMLNYVDFYEVVDDHIRREVHTGELRPFISRDVLSRNFVFRLHLSPKTETTFLLRVYNSGETVRIPLFLGDQWSFYNKSLLEFGVGVFFYGLLFFAFVFNMLLFFSIRERLYLLFSLYVFVLTLFMFSVDGMAYRFLWPDHPEWQNKSTIVVIYFVHLFLLAFADNFIRYKQYIPTFHKVNIVTGAIALILLTGTLFSYPFYRYIAIIANVFTLILLFIVILGSVCAVIKGRRTANLFIISFVILLTGSLTYVFRNMGIMPDHFISQYGLKLGLTFQVVFLCFTVFERFKVALTERREKLEAMVAERTEQIEEQKAEIEAQRDSLMDQHGFIQRQNNEITDSIRYAERIQKALLPLSETLSDYFTDSFIFYQPRDIVSGDFYWVAEKNNKLVLVAADCTGHGVPGGFMSVLGIAYLNEVVNNEEFCGNAMHASFILDQLTNHVVTALHNSTREYHVRDSMDMTVCIIDKEKSEMEFAGANNPIYVVGHEEFNVFKGVKKTVGLNPYSDKPFVDVVIPLQKGDMIYCFSDGYIDQLGGEQKKTFRSSRFRDLLLKIASLGGEEQHRILGEELLSWKGNAEQTDDIMVVGVRL